MAKIIDLTKTIQYNKHDPFAMKVKIKYLLHKPGKLTIRLLGLPFSLFPENFDGWSAEIITRLGTHATTHLDAPWHFGKTSGGVKAKTIDEVPLEWCYGDGIVLDMCHKADCDPVTIEDVQKELARTNSVICKGTIVLVMTGRDRYQGTKKYQDVGPGVSPEATEWLIDQGVKVMGTDAWGWDMPLRAQIKKSKETGDRNLFWAAHRIGNKKEYSHIEQLTNLKALPPKGFKVAVFPLKISRASGAPVRAVAIFEECIPE